MSATPPCGGFQIAPPTSFSDYLSLHQRYRRRFPWTLKAALAWPAPGIGINSKLRKSQLIYKRNRIRSLPGQTWLRAILPPTAKCMAPLTPLLASRICPSQGFGFLLDAGGSGAGTANKKAKFASKKTFLRPDANRERG